MCNFSKNSTYLLWLAPHYLDPRSATPLDHRPSSYMNLEFANHMSHAVHRASSSLPRKFVAHERVKYSRCRSTDVCNHLRHASFWSCRFKKPDIRYRPFRLFQKFKHIQCKLAKIQLSKFEMHLTQVNFMERKNGSSDSNKPSYGSWLAFPIL